MAAIDGFFCSPIYTYNSNLGHRKTLSILPGMNHFDYKSVYLCTHTGRSMIYKYNSSEYSGVPETLFTGSNPMMQGIAKSMNDNIAASKSKTAYDPASRLRGV